MSQAAVVARHGVRTARCRIAGVLRAAVILALFSFMVGPAPVHAHTDVVGSTPRAGDTVTFRTDQLVLVFGDDLVGSGQVTVHDADDVDVVADSGTIAGATLQVPLDLRRPGRHLVTYRVVASDGHVVVGEFSFDVSGAEKADSPQGSSGASVDQADSTSDRRSVTPEAATAAPAPKSSAVTPAWWLAAVAAVAGAGWLGHRLLPHFSRTASRRSRH